MSLLGILDSISPRGQGGDPQSPKLAICLNWRLVVPDVGDPQSPTSAAAAQNRCASAPQSLATATQGATLLEDYSGSVTVAGDGDAKYYTPRGLQRQ
ncbi:hypothetical protein Y032_0632g886 [Ancylostoma ceylanicum]|uniref:Uncharacterized protein n=1 Tax=Ancylostoma ceylanicum TaxID=53326 RepID=A0A016WKF1_9BILA|nr:hypothetical protein Y032_0632g886 [Ancylostoma ceylanicum]